MTRYALVALVCGLAGAIGLALEVLWLNDNETVASAWRILATSVVALLLFAALGAAVIGRARRHG